MRLSCISAVALVVYCFKKIYPVNLHLASPLQPITPPSLKCVWINNYKLYFQVHNMWRRGFCIFIWNHNYQGGTSNFTQKALILAGQQKAFLTLLSFS